MVMRVDQVEVSTLCFLEIAQQRLSYKPCGFEVWW